MIQFITTLSLILALLCCSGPAALVKTSQPLPSSAKVLNSTEELNHGDHHDQRNLSPADSAELRHRAANKVSNQFVIAPTTTRAPPSGASPSPQLSTARPIEDEKRPNLFRRTTTAIYKAISGYFNQDDEDDDDDDDEKLGDGRQAPGRAARTTVAPSSTTKRQSTRSMEQHIWISRRL